MMKDIVLLETMLIHPEKEVFRLRFATDAFDMAVLDPDEIACKIYEVKHSGGCRFRNDTRI